MLYIILIMLNIIGYDISKSINDKNFYRILLKNYRNHFFQQSYYKNSKFKFGFKLVRGAYMEKERDLALKEGYKSPICQTKTETDQNFDNCIDLMFDNLDMIDFFVASHNENSNLKVIDKMNKFSLSNDNEKVWFGQLYGMGDNISYNLAKNGYNVAKILPFGPVENLMPYLIRRAQENSSIEGQSNRELDLINSELIRRSKI